MAEPILPVFHDGEVHEPYCVCRKCERALGEDRPWYVCANCGAHLADWETFTSRDQRTWCLGHIPWRSRIRLWWQERRNG